MNEAILKARVRSLIRKVLLERGEEPDGSPKKEPPKKEPPKKEPPKPAAGPIGMTVAKGAYGSGGRFKDFVKEAEARANTTPKALLRDLGVKSGISGTDLDQLKKLINVALHSNPTMREAYGGATVLDAADLPDGRVVKGIGVHMAALDKRNGIKFIMHILTAAKKAGFLNLQGSIELNRSGKAPIVIYSV